MAVSVSWDKPNKSRLRYTIEGKWTLDELYAAMEQGYALQDEAEDSLEIIVDTLQGQGIPSNLQSIASYVRKNRRRKDNLIVVLTTNGIIRAMAKLFTQLSRSETQFWVATNDEEAEAIFAERRRNVNQGG